MHVDVYLGIQKARSSHVGLVRLKDMGAPRIFIGSYLARLEQGLAMCDAGLQEHPEDRHSEQWLAVSEEYLCLKQIAQAARRWMMGEQLMEAAQPPSRHSYH